MTIEYRLITEEEFTDWRVAVRRGFNQQVHPEDIARLRKDRVEIDRIFGAFEGEHLVGTGGADSYMLTVPGGQQIPTAGIAYIGTAATHLRRGILTGMMRTLLTQATDRKEPVATLWASQAGIYSRFGFGQTTVAEDWSINTANSAYAHSPKGTGKTKFVSHSEALEIMPAVWDQVRKTRAGFLDRSPSRWQYFFYDAERLRGEWSGMFHVVYENNGVPEGYAAYRLKPEKPDYDDLLMHVIEEVDSTPESHAAIWRFLFDVDLVRQVSASYRPAADPLWWMLTNPRELKRQPTDGMWARILDVEAALQARSYSEDGNMVIEVKDAFAPEAGGRFELAVSDGRAKCSRTTRQPDLSLTQSELSAAYLGGVKLSGLTMAGRATQHRTDAIGLFDRMFTTSEPPWCPHEF
jgi:predicted acetyltransferase